MNSDKTGYTKQDVDALCSSHGYSEAINIIIRQLSLKWSPIKTPRLCQELNLITNYHLFYDDKNNLMMRYINARKAKQF